MMILRRPAISDFNANPTAKSTILFLALFAAFFCIFAVYTKPSFAQIAPVTTDSRIRTLVYSQNEVYELKFFYGYQSFIEFAEDEEIEMISIGEAFAWRLTPSGRRLFIRPLEVAAHTNMTIITNRRTYNFDMRSGEYDGRADEELVYTVRFYYPQSNEPIPIVPMVPQIGQLAQQPAHSGPITSTQTGSATLAPGVKAFVNKKLPGEYERNPEGLQLNFDYSVAGNDESIVPIKIYDNSKETFLKFKNENFLIPSIFMVDIFGAETPITYKVEDGYVVIKAIEPQFSLRIGASLVCIYNNKMLSAMSVRP